VLNAPRKRSRNVITASTLRATIDIYVRICSSLLLNFISRETSDSACVVIGSHHETMPHAMPIDDPFVLARNEAGLEVDAGHSDGVICAASRKI
jgi:hypothetical protein